MRRVSKKHTTSTAYMYMMVILLVACVFVVLYCKILQRSVVNDLYYVDVSGHVIDVAPSGDLRWRPPSYGYDFRKRQTYFWSSSSGIH